MELINFYIDNILKNQLESFGLLSCDIILEDVRTKMLSLLNHWKDTEFRNAVLITGFEESEFYEPNANKYLKAFIVLAIRNTTIESAGSDFYKEYKFETQLSDDQIRLITEKAIIYFKQYSLDDISSNVSCSNDYYYSVSQKYPEAFKVMKLLSALKKKEMYFESLKIDKKSVLLPNPNTGMKNTYVIEDGVSLEFNDQLINTLNQAVTIKKLGMFTDCFKFLTRNYEKVLKIIQYLIENGSSFCTFNYYISNGYIAKRTKLMRASHKVKELNYKFKKNNELSSRHKRCLDLWKEVYRH